MKPGMLILVILSFAVFNSPQAQEQDRLHTPRIGSPERQAILDAWRQDYPQSHKGKLTFKVTYLKVHSGWAWIDGEPISNDPSDSFGETRGFLLHLSNGKWKVMSTPAYVEDPNDPEKLCYPSREDIKMIRKKYPSIPADIFPVVSAGC